VDDSECTIAGKKHTILGAVSFLNEGSVIAALAQCKEEAGIGALTELKWNSQTLTQAQRHYLTEKVVPVICHCRACLVICEGYNKTAAATQLAAQVSDYCAEAGYAGFTMRFDQDIVGDNTRFKASLEYLNPPILGWGMANSSTDPLIQCADLFTGFQKLRIDYGIGRKTPIKAELEVYEGTRETYDLSWYLRLAFQGCLWGRVPESEDSKRTFDKFKANLGYGVRVFSSVPREALDRATREIGEEYMGCIH